MKWLIKFLGIGATAGALYVFSDAAIAAIGALLLGVAGMFVYYAGIVFNFLVEHIVIGFATTLKVLGMSDGINVVWTVFRDLSNIVIIGMFVFIAISLILGIKGYGERKMIARVLIIAVLINFSLLFTKMIIDASNFTAYQFYTASQFPKTDGGFSAPAGATSDVGTGQTDGIAGGFLHVMGVGGIWDNQGLIEQIVEKQGGAVGLAYGLVGATLLLIVAAVFLYGAFLIVARGALLVFIMVVSPLAFASYLIPTYEASGWKRWWETLLKSALFFPLLTIFLWASLLILSNATGTGGGATIGQFLSQEETQNAWRPIIVMLFSVAFLFISIRFASSFSGSIAGFSGAAAATLAPFTLGSRAVSPFLRRWRGGKAQRKVLDLDESIDKQKTALTQASNAQRPAALRELQKLYRGKGRAEKRAGSDYNLFQTAAGKAVTSGLGVTGFLSGAGEKAVGGFAAGAKAKSEAAAKKAAEVGLSERDAAERLREVKRSDRDYKQRNRAMEQERDDAAKIVKTNKETAKQLIQDGGLSNRHSAAKQKESEVKNEVIKANEAAHRDFESNGDGEHRDEILRAGDEKIRQVSSTVNELQNRIDTINKPVREAEQVYGQALQKLEKFDRDVEKEIQTSARRVAKQSVKDVQGLSARLTNPRWTDYLPQGVKDSLDNKTVARMARVGSKKKVRLKDRAAVRGQERAELRDAGLLNGDNSSS